MEGIKKTNRKIFLFLLITIIIFQTTIISYSQNDSTEDMNNYVIKAAESFPTNGTSNYYWPKGTYVYDGCTSDVFFMNQRVMKGEPQGRSFCCGFTLEIFYMALNNYLKDHNMKSAGSFSPKNAKDFMSVWFVLEKNGDGPGDAMIKYGIGKRINSFDEAKRGDFVQLWRYSGSGHSVILWDVIKDNEGKIKEIKYFSTQPGTKGINFNTEPVGPPKGINLEHTHISRMLPPSTWK